MATFTITLPNKLLDLLAQKAKTLSLPNNKLIEAALIIYLEHLEMAEYIKSYKVVSEDEDIVAFAEVGMKEYFRQLQSPAS